MSASAATQGAVWCSVELDGKIGVRQTYKLAQIQQARHDLEARKTAGSTVILP